MNESIHREKKPGGCWKWTGCLLMTVSGLLIALLVAMIVYSEKEMDENRAEYAASMEEYEAEVKAYEADSALFVSQYGRTPEFHQRGAIGVNIGGAFFLVFALILLIPFGIGLLMLLYYRRK